MTLCHKDYKNFLQPAPLSLNRSNENLTLYQLTITGVTLNDLSALLQYCLFSHAHFTTLQHLLLVNDEVPGVPPGKAHDLTGC